MRGGVYERSLERKIREAILAVQLERRYTKREIFTLYANQVPLHGAYGVEAGSRMYFNKSAKDLTLDEAATMAAVIQTPARLSPFVNPDRTLARRNNYVLPRMAEEGFVTRAAAEAAAQRPSTKPGSRCRPRWTSSCSAPPSGRSIAASAVSTSAVGCIARQRERLPPRSPRRPHTPRRAGRAPLPPVTSCRPW
jgi:membrane peptidoglycan carboxypeptidase